MSYKSGYQIYTVEPVLPDTPRDQGNVSDFTGCQNTRVLFLVNRYTLGP